MNIKEYIASGILESYLAGELDKEEMRTVDSIASLYPEVQDQLNELRVSLNRYAAATGNLPDEETLKVVLQKIKEDEKEHFLNAIDGSETNFRRVNIVPRWTVAASILLSVSIAFNVFFYAQMMEQSKKVRLIAQENALMAQNIEKVDQQLDYAELRIAHFLNKDNVHVRMEGSDLSPKSYANVFWNVKSNAVFISVDNLPEPPAGHQYQLWAIKPGQAPIDAGIFDHSLLVQELKVIKGDVIAFAVTLEKEGGTPIATVDQTYVKGFLKKS
ncbi:MAG: hypothetical protein COW03_02190 [Cytophagales bacterium CG12_big_fil_rev_8_21_14_0_65_40_12]|nr:MAG: hypothetical protein COW03_02190 [Cytophagales bacterium CG12_big_fil_rev_8_21_14_0_65_40_12]PIW05157.1 MAG: hypothetical protein COW40_06045 [Cytophagales bacterium CG17_big_fil_post_rev_8_21_14_2_50_40_13]